MAKAGKQGGNLMVRRGPVNFSPPVKRVKAPKSKPKTANGRNPKLVLTRVFKKTWHKDRTWKPMRRIYNLAVWLRKVGL